MKNTPRKCRIPDPPLTPRKPVVDNVHGTLIEDPYRWLEDGSSPETALWTEAQNRRTDEVMSQLPERDELSRQMFAEVSKDIVGSPMFCGRRLFYTRRRAGVAQPVLCARELEGASSETVLVDPNAMSDKGLVALDWWRPSGDGSMLAFGCSLGGDEWSVLRILNVETGEVLPERIERARMSSVTWNKDNRGFYYTRYPKTGEAPPGEENYNSHLFHHRLGDDPARDPKVFGEGRPKELMYGASLSGDGRYLVVSATHGWNSTDMYVRHETVPGETFQTITEGETALFEDVEVVGSTLYVLTNYRAPKFRVCALDLSVPLANPPAWRDIVPEKSDMTLTSFSICEGHIAITALKDAVSHLYICDMDGGHMKEVPLAVRSTIGHMAGHPGSPELFFAFESFVVAPTICRLYVDGPAAPETFLSSEQPEGVGTVQVKQVIYRSKDGTAIPMFIVEDVGRRHGSSKEARPTVLTGYGGFNLSKTPAYTPTVIPWLRAGGVYAVANLRGGNEYGEEWHRAGMRQSKQNVFDDYIAAAEYLIDSGVTDRAHLGIWGRSNGGLLVGAAMTQRPDLFAAVSCGVPLLDMVRYHKFLIAYMWTSEYGNADEPEDFKWLYAYSPYHKVRQGCVYPPVFFYTAASDSRVDPLHARKMTAKLQEVQVGLRDSQGQAAPDNPALLRVEFDAGHGVGKPVRKIVDEQAEWWAFLAWRLGLDIKAPTAGNA